MPMHAELLDELDELLLLDDDDDELLDDELLLLEELLELDELDDGAHTHGSCRPTMTLSPNV